MESFLDRYRQEIQAALHSVPDRAILAAVEALRQAHMCKATVFVLCPPDAGECVDRFARQLYQCASAGLFGFRVVRISAGAAQFTPWQNEWTLEDAYLQHLHGAVKQGDVTVAFSHGQHDDALARALQVSRQAGASAIAISTDQSTVLAQAADISLQVSQAAPEQLEAIQGVLAGLLCSALRKAAGG